MKKTISTLALACCLSGALVAHAAPHARPKAMVKTIAKPSADAPLRALSIALPPGARVEFEVDGGEQDVLGMAKSFMRGLEAANAKKSGVAASSSNGSWLQLLADKQFSAILKDVRHLHLVVYRLPRAEDSAISNTVGTMSGTMEAPVFTPAPRATESALPSPLGRTMESFDALAFHEKPLLGAGGRRSLRLDRGKTRVQMFAFESPRGLGLIVQSPSRVIVARSEGLPDMTALGRLIHFNGTP